MTAAGCVKLGPTGLTLMPTGARADHVTKPFGCPGSALTDR